MRPTRSEVRRGTFGQHQVLPSNQVNSAAPSRASVKLSFLAAAILTAFYLATSLYIAAHRLFWFDEIFTVSISRLPHNSSIWTALAHAADSLPPVYYLIVRFSEKVFGQGEVAARLPSALAMAAGLLITFDCARRLSDGLHGLIALCVLSCSYLPYYGYEARSYAVYFMLAALSLWLWACTSNDDLWAALAFGGTLFFAVTVHYYAVLLLVPYALFELAHWKAGQRPSRKLIAGVVGTVLPVLLFLPVILPFARQFSPGFWARPTFHQLQATLPALFPDGLFLLVLITIWIVLLARDKPLTVNAMSSGEAVGWLFLAMLLAGFALAKWKTNAFVDRYFIGVLPGVAVAFSCLLWRNYRVQRMVAYGALLILATCGMARQISTARHPEAIDSFLLQQDRTRQFRDLEPMLHNEGKRYIVFPSDLVHLEAAYYSPHPEDCILLLGADGARESNRTRMELNLAHYYPLQFWEIDDLRRHARETALIDPRPSALHALQEAGFTTFKRMSTSGLEVLYVQ